jgi:hypothetical protein
MVAQTMFGHGPGSTMFGLGPGSTMFGLGPGSIDNVQTRAW